jgi:hypothetical protein
VGVGVEGGQWSRVLQAQQIFYLDQRSESLELGLGTEFRSEKIPRNRLGTVSVIPRKKALIPRHSEFRGRANSEARNGTEWNSTEKNYFTITKQNLPWYLYRGGGRGGAVYKRSKIHPQTWKCFTNQQQKNLTK